MGVANEVQRLAEQLEQADVVTLLQRWEEAVVKRSWKLRTLSSDDDPLAMLSERGRHFLEALKLGLRSSDTLAVGSPGYREAVQSLSFTAGWMAGAGLAVTDAVALVYGLEEVLGGQWPKFYEALMVVVTEAFASSLVQRERARFRDVMEKSQVVCDPHPKLPCLFLVGEPDRQALEDAAGRVMMLAVMRDAPAVMVDGSALLSPERVLPIACPILAEHAEAASVQVVVGGVSPALTRDLKTTAGTQMGFVESHQEALAEAMKASGLAWTESSG